MGRNATQRRFCGLLSEKWKSWAPNSSRILRTLVCRYRFVVPSGLRVPAWTAGILAIAGPRSIDRKSWARLEDRRPRHLAHRRLLVPPISFPCARLLSFFSPTFLSFNPKVFDHRLAVKCRLGIQRLLAASSDLLVSFTVSVLSLSLCETSSGTWLTWYRHMFRPDHRRSYMNSL